MIPTQHSIRYKNEYTSWEVKRDEDRRHKNKINVTVVTRRGKEEGRGRRVEEERGEEKRTVVTIREKRITKNKTCQ